MKQLSISPCTVLVYNTYPTIYPRIAAGLEYKDKVSHCPQGRKKRGKNLIRCNWKKLN